MRPLTRALAVVALSAGVVLTARPPAGFAQDVPGPELKTRLKYWTSGPHRDLLFQGAPVEPPPAAGRRAVALCVGVDYRNREHYGDRAPRLLGAVQDAVEMGNLARMAGFDVTLMTDERATAGAVTKFLDEQARVLRADDTLLLYFAGFGGAVPDDPTNPDEPDGKKMDFALCLADRLLIDDELFEAWKGLVGGVRVIFITDCSFTGLATDAITNLDRDLSERGRLPDRVTSSVLPEHRAAIAAARAAIEAGEFRPLAGQPRQAPTVRVRVFDDAELRYRAYPDYRVIERRKLQGRGAELKATVVYLAASLRGSTSPAIELNGRGLFTAALVETWNRGHFRGSYRDLLAEARNRVPSQDPQYATFGPPNAAFLTGQTFSK